MTNNKLFLLFFLSMEILEKKVVGNHSPFTYEKIIKFCKFSEKRMCKIIIYENDNKIFGSGFFCKFNIKEFSFIQRPFLVTCNHVINKDYLDSKDKIILEINKKEKILYLEDRIKLTDPQNDFTIIEIKNYDKIYYFFEVSTEIMEDNFKTDIKDKDIILPQFPGGEELSLGLGSILEIDELDITHSISTKYGSSGSPIISSNNWKIIGIHTMRLNNGNKNGGTFIKSILLSIEKMKNKQNINMIEEKPILNIANLELIKIVKNFDTFFTEIIILKDGRLCSMDLNENIKIYNRENFDIEIEINNNRSCDDEDEEEEKEKYDYSDEYKLACTNYNELIFIANNVINIAIILNEKEFKITQKLEVGNPFKLSILYNKICCICHSPNSSYFLLFEKQGNEYKQTKDSEGIYPYDNYSCHRENFKFKKWKIELTKYRNYMLLSINGGNFHTIDNWNFYKNQKLFIEPSFLILGQDEVLIDLEKLEKGEYFEFEQNEFTIQKGTSIKEKEEEWHKCKNKCYENLNDSSFLYLDDESYLYQILFGKNKFDFKVSEKREDIRGLFFIRKDNLLFILNKKKINIYHF